MVGKLTGLWGFFGIFTKTKTVRSVHRSPIDFEKNFVKKSIRTKFYLDQYLWVKISGLIHDKKYKWFLERQCFGRTLEFDSAPIMNQVPWETQTLELRRSKTWNTKHTHNQSLPAIRYYKSLIIWATKYLLKSSMIDRCICNQWFSK